MVLCTHLPCSLINVFAFLFVKANSMEICEEISFPSFFSKKLMSIYISFVEIQGQLSRKHAWLP